MSAKPILYSLDWSPAVRSVWLTAKYIGLDLEIRNVDIAKGEQLSEQYLRMNPQHTVPTLDDNGIYLWESAPICTYLIAKYGPAEGSCLYPVDPEQRARIDQRLYFNASILFPLFRESSIAVFFHQCTELRPGLLPEVAEAFDHLEGFLRTGEYLVGDSLTLADLVTVTTVGNIGKWAPLAAGGRHARIALWLEKIGRELPGFEELNAKPLEAYGRLFRESLARNRDQVLG